MQLFTGSGDFRSFMNTRLNSMEKAIEQQLKCSEVADLPEEKLAAMARKYAQQYGVATIPTLDLSSPPDKFVDQNTGQRVWQAPYSGDKFFFTLSPPDQPGYILHAGLTDKNIVIAISEPIEQSEKAAQDLLKEITKVLDFMRSDKEEHFSLKKFEEIAASKIREKQEYCAKLSAGGYKVR